MSKRQLTLTNRIVDHLISKYDLRNSGLVESPSADRNQVEWKLIREEVEGSRYTPAVLGIICANGASYHGTKAETQTPMYIVHCGTWISKYDGGRNILRDMAATVLFAMIHDRLKKEQEFDDLLSGPEFDFLREE
ncbi:hypothetical protein KC571_02310 [candidate division WWE3 bacterium]|uniref:Uncharacterized protein n=1 Tax=candidate division WWE3 bacterium TaxID=2053526 RepID=A0A955LHA3_UNCKA|nr:hypothetical protein [candidate division WWE3 bacterium]